MHDRKPNPPIRIRKSLFKSNLSAVFVFAQIATIASFYFVYSTMNFRYHLRLSEVMVESVRTSTIIGDYRSAISTLNANFAKDFKGVALYTSENQRIFSLPPSTSLRAFSGTDFLEYIQNGRVVVPVQFNEHGETTKFGDYIFVYPRFSFIWYWGATALLALILGNWFFRQARNRLLENQELIKMTEVANARFKMAKQVSHDIRSPLTALSMLSSQLSMIPEEQRLLLRHAAQRITDIANQLLRESGPHANPEIAGEECYDHALNSREQKSKGSVTMLAPLVESIVSEKRVQFREKIHIHLSSEIRQSYGLFSRINAVEIRRVLSNLINNAVESFPSNCLGGLVTVTVKKDEGFAIIEVKDNGKGIPPNVLEKIGNEGFSFGKAGIDSGSGLGIYHANLTVVESGGALKISSEINRGTIVQIKLPRVSPPDWFLENVSLSPNAPLVILDDDQSIHEVWKERFRHLCTEDERLAVFHYTSAEALLEDVKSNESLGMAQFFIDFELLNQSDNGLSVIKKLSLAERAILVTSRFEEDFILNECNRLKVKLLPKALVEIVPIELLDVKLECDAILIDDDSLVNMSWELKAKETGKKLILINPEGDVIGDVFRYSKTTPIYIDSNLGQGKHGEEILIVLAKNGYRNLFLATGYSQDALGMEDVPFLVVGKDPPWTT